jgi:hypothetical protein
VLRPRPRITLGTMPKASNIEFETPPRGRTLARSTSSRVGSRNPAASDVPKPPFKACCFPCNGNTHTSDLKNPKLYMKWGRADYRSKCDWYCFKTFQKTLNDRFDTPEAAADYLKTNKCALDEFMVEKAELVERVKDGHVGFERRSGAKSVSVHEKESYCEDIRPPANWFCPISDYLKFFKQVQKKAKHVKGHTLLVSVLYTCRHYISRCSCSFHILMSGRCIAFVYWTIVS